MTDLYRIDTPDEIFSPGLVIFRDVVLGNLGTMIGIAHDPARLRPHCKTHKMTAVTKLELERGILKHKAATFAEAEMLAAAGVNDVFLAYNMVGPNIARAVRFRQRYPDVAFSVTADDVESVKQLGQAMSEARQTIGVLLDVNPGRDRTGLPVGDEAARLYELISRTPGLEPAGFHLYDGHLHLHDPEEREKAVQAQWKPVSRFRDELVGRKLPVPRIVCGGTYTFPMYAAMSDPAVELSPGTCVFHDAGYDDEFPDLRVFQAAALVLTRVISRPTPNRVTFDVGSKAVASDPPSGTRVVFPDIPDAVQVLHNEEHLVVETKLADRFRPGDWTLVIPRHICPTVLLYRDATIISDGRIVDHWEVTARDR